MQENVSVLVNAYGSAEIGANIRIMGYFELDNNLEYFLNLRLNSNKIYMACVAGGQSYNTTNANITIEYTKTTD